MALSMFAQSDNDGGDATDTDASRDSIKIKSCHRKAQALIFLGKQVSALEVYKHALKDHPLADELRAAARLALNSMPSSWIAKYWSSKVAKAEAPNPLSSRDGVLLRKVPASKRLHDFEGPLTSLIAQNEPFREECKDLMVESWADGNLIRRSDCAYVRAAVYFEAGNQQQCEHDATVALVYGPCEKDGTPNWHAAFYLRSICYEKIGEYVAAVFDILQAIENGVGMELYNMTLDRLLPRIPEHYADAIRSGCGFAGLERMINAEKERSKPEFMRNRPKYYYYYEWMKKRILERHPSISESVMDKLLTVDATELDLLLQYPAAIDSTVEQLESVLQENGTGYLETYEVPLLTWDQVKQLETLPRAIAAGSSEQLTLPPAKV